MFKVTGFAVPEQGRRHNDLRIRVGRRVLRGYRAGLYTDLDIIKYDSTSNKQGANPQYSEEAAKLARERTLAFLKKHL